MTAVSPQAPQDPLTGLSAARFGVYVHFPFCLSKCPYCDFASIVARQVPEDRYARAIVRELDLRADGCGPREVQSIFFGGGTPSLWSAANVGRVLEALGRRFSLASGLEVTLEANPGASDAARFADYRRAGINRLSIGVQSFEPELLRALGRAHDAAEAERAFRAARRGGFENVSMDFIYGVQGQTVAQAERDAKRAVGLEPEHLSAYALTLDRESLAEEVPLARQLARGEVTLPSDEDTVAMARAIRDVYAVSGLSRYEISNYARPGFHSRHNSLYWTGGEYLALGVGATGFLLESPRAGRRYANVRSAEQYLAAVEAGRMPEASSERLGPKELFEERLAMGLRLSTGVDVEAVCGAYGFPARPRREEIDRLVAKGLAAREGGRVKLTEAGADLHSAIAARLM